MGSRSLVGMEVPLSGSDYVTWHDVTVPSSAADNGAPPTVASPRTKDVASCSVFGNPPNYLFWRIHKDHPHSLEIQEFCGYKDFPKTGLRLIFPNALFPFAHICKDETSPASGTGSSYLLYALTTSGVGYLLRLQNLSRYGSCTVFPLNEMTEINVQCNPHYGEITDVAATAGCLAIGRNDGSVSCFQLGTHEPSAPGFLYDLRDESGLGRLWGLMSRRSIGAVQDLVMSEVHGRNLLFVLHSDGVLRVWDLLSRCRICTGTINAPTLTEDTFINLWVGEANIDTHAIPLAILCRSSLEVGSEIISVHNLSYGLGDRTTFVLDSSEQNIPVEGVLIDVKVTANKIWILKEDGLTMLSLFNTPDNVSGAQCYSLQEAFVADQLFQSSEHSSDDLLWLSQSLGSSVKDQVAPLVSSIFLRRLLSPGVHHNTVLRATFQDHNKHLTDSEFSSLTVDGLKKEILSLIGHEGVSASPISLLYCWKNFTTRYFHMWCEINAPVGFMIDLPRGTIGLIRKNSVSVFRSLEDIELLIYGSFDEVGDIVGSGLDFSGDNLDCEILFDVLRCVSNINQQLGKAASSVFYESVISTPSISSEEIIPRLLKILQCGHNPSVTTLHISELGADAAWEKEVGDHKNLRKFSVEMFLALNALSTKAVYEWGKVLDVIERYLNLLVPRKVIQKLGSEVGVSSSTSAIVLATSQVAKVMFESALDILLFLSYLVNISGQIHLLHKEISKIQLELVPMIQEVMSEWHIIHYLGTTASESPVIDDFSSQLSSLQLDNNYHKRSWDEKLGKCDFTLACLLLLNIQISHEDHGPLFLKYLPDPANFINSVRNITSWIIWGSSGEETSGFFSHSTELALILFRHGQYDAVEYLLTTVDTHLRKERTSESIQSDDGQWGTLLHILGCCLLAQAQRRLQGVQKQEKVGEAVRCFFRASSVKGAPHAFRSFSKEAGLHHLAFTSSLSLAAWKLQYYQWAMQVFEQYNYSEGACQFAFAALEQVDDALGTRDDNHEEDNQHESVIVVRGRLWANVFKFTLDLNNYFDAYCAIISNPDEESKNICLRRFIIVLYERGAVKILCNGILPFIGLADKVEQELASKAARAEVSAKPNPFKLLYAFEMHRHNWRKAATYIYSYSSQLKTATAFRKHQGRSLILQERLDALSASINALHLVHPPYAWMDTKLEDKLLLREHFPNKKARLSEHEQSADKSIPAKHAQSYVDIEKLENEFVLTSAEYVLSLSNVNWTNSGNGRPSADVVDLLVQADLYDMAFTVILKFWKGSELKRELERVFISMSLKCCPDRAGHLFNGNAHRPHGLLMASSRNEVVIHGSPDAGPPEQQPKGNTQWETLELYLEKYKRFHPSLPVIVAEAVLSSDPQIELPLWLVQMFKCVRREGNQGMAGNEANPASLFRLYVDYRRFPEATNLLLEFIESYASTRPNEVVRRKRPSAVWFPYTTIERLWVQLEEYISKNYMVDQCQKMKTLLQGALRGHLNKLREDSADVQASALVEKS